MSLPSTALPAPSSEREARGPTALPLERGRCHAFGSYSPIAAAAMLLAPCGRTNRHRSAWCRAGVTPQTYVGAAQQEGATRRECRSDVGERQVSEGTIDESVRLGFLLCFIESYDIFTIGFVIMSQQWYIIIKNLTKPVVKIWFTKIICVVDY